MLSLGVVVETHPEDHSVDLVMVGDGARLVGVQALTSGNTDRSGGSGLPDVRPLGDKWDITERADNQMIAVVGQVMGQPLVVGFLTPQINQMLFADKERFVNRWPSDNYACIDEAANVEFYHPSGTYVRIAEDPEHEDLAGKDYDGKWGIDRNTQRRPHVRVQMAGGTAHLNISPDGAVSLYAASTVDVKCEATVSIVAADKIVTNAPVLEHTGEVDITGNVKISGNVAVEGNVAVQGGISATGTASMGGSITTDGSLTAQGDVQGGGISLLGHTHRVMGGSSAGNTSPSQS